MNEIVKIYIKHRGFEEYYEVELVERTSKRGNHYFEIVAHERISKYKYYNNKEVAHLIRTMPFESINSKHEIKAFLPDFDKKTLF